MFGPLILSTQRLKQQVVLSVQARSCLCHKKSSENKMSDIKRGKKGHKPKKYKNKAKENGAPGEQNLTCLLLSYVHFFLHCF